MNTVIILHRVRAVYNKDCLCKVQIMFLDRLWRRQAYR
jgi:hypothetical protein